MERRKKTLEKEVPIKRQGNGEDGNTRTTAGGKIRGAFHITEERKWRASEGAWGSRGGAVKVSGFTTSRLSSPGPGAARGVPDEPGSTLTLGEGEEVSMERSQGTLQSRFKQRENSEQTSDDDEETQQALIGKWNDVDGGEFQTRVNNGSEKNGARSVPPVRLLFTLLLPSDLVIMSRRVVVAESGGKGSKGMSLSDRFSQLASARPARPVQRSDNRDGGREGFKSRPRGGGVGKNFGGREGRQGDRDSRPQQGGRNNGREGAGRGGRVAGRSGRGGSISSSMTLPPPTSHLLLAFAFELFIHFIPGRADGGKREKKAATPADLDKVCPLL